MSNLVVAPQMQTEVSNSSLNQEDIEILKNSKFKGFTDREIQYCCKVVKLLNLNPFLNQIHFTRRKNKDGSFSIVTQIGIDGFRLTAQRAGAYAGSDEPVYQYGEKDKDQQNPLKASVTVYKIVQGIRCPFTASARWDEYYPGSGNTSFMWDKMPHNQLAKCAESLALRKAFPAELGGIYSDDEMHQAQQTTVYPSQPEKDDGNTEPQGYRVGFGQWRGLSIEEIYRKHGREKIASYIEYIERAAVKKGVAIEGAAKEFIDQAEAFLGAMENVPTE